VDVLYQHGARGNAYFAVTHPVLLPTALEYLESEDRIEKLVVTNSISIPPEKSHPKLKVISVAPLLADIIHRIHEGISISPKLILS
jgi:ribose-phosphate pyrophosphokinase